MDPDVKSKMERLCENYLQAESKLALARPSQLPTGRAQRRLEEHVVDALGRLRTARKPLEAALLRLAYVRGLRSSQPGARLTAANEQELSYLEARLDHALAQVENQAWMNLQNHLRRLRVADTAKSTGASPAAVELIMGTKPYPLEQYARASIHTITEMAATAGTLAGTRAGSYDGPENAE